MRYNKESTLTQDMQDRIYVHDMLTSGRAKGVRERHGLSKRAVSREVQGSENCVLRWERGEAFPQARLLSRYADLLRALERA